MNPDKAGAAPVGHPKDGGRMARVDIKAILRDAAQRKVLLDRAVETVIRVMRWG